MNRVNSSAFFFLCDFFEPFNLASNALFPFIVLYPIVSSEYVYWTHRPIEWRGSSHASICSATLSISSGRITWIALDRIPCTYTERITARNYILFRDDQGASGGTFLTWSFVFVWRFPGSMFFIRTGLFYWVLYLNILQRSEHSFLLRITILLLLCCVISKKVILSNGLSLLTLSYIFFIVTWEVYWLTVKW